MFKVHFEVLTELQKREFPELAKFSKLGMLVGGTALALQLKHRHSYDFDIFLPKPLPTNLRVKARKIFGPLKIVRHNSGELTFYASSGLKITFFEYNFKNLYPPIDVGPIKMAHWRDIAVDKSYTIGQRAQYRDYVDLFFILKMKNVTLDWLIRNTEKKFGDLFPEKLFLQQLIYVDDLQITKIEFLRDSYTAEEIKTFFERLAENYTKEKLK
ncbi:MAG TPA: nucleotidyl transferase AbiEii/AbiGii toxin family protein [Patescibacteria group bacterium]|nr:nucleotidyl transferase AbiEii/AbiGii toxin family protein [Patescibacteria group bacterium]